MNDNGELKKEPSKLNTILLWVTLACLAFIARTSWSNSISVAKIEAVQIARPEIEAKISEVKASLIGTEKEISDINLQIVRLQMELAQQEIIRPKKSH